MIGTIGTWITAILAGAAVGTLYLGLLWTGTRALDGPRPTLVFVALGAARAALVVGALAGAVALGADAEVLVAALAGFVIARITATRLAGAAERRRRWR